MCWTGRQLASNVIASTARRNSKFKIQNSKLMHRKRFIDLEWVVYLRHAVLVVAKYSTVVISL